jgi:hypothetical protein
MPNPFSKIPHFEKKFSECKTQAEFKKLLDELKNKPSDFVPKIQANSFSIRTDYARRITTEIKKLEVQEKQKVAQSNEQENSTDGQETSSARTDPTEEEIENCQTDEELDNLFSVEKYPKKYPNMSSTSRERIAARRKKIEADKRSLSLFDL